MTKFSEQLQEADWKQEKHVPVIECRDSVKSGEIFEVQVSIGKEISHPNTTEHHIRFIELYFKPEGDKFTYQVGAYSFSAHGESVDGPNTGAVTSDHSVVARLVLRKSGDLFAVSLCNIHGLWQSSRKITVT
jgi:superoxide reductase